MKETDVTKDASTPSEDKAAPNWDPITLMKEGKVDLSSSPLKQAKDQDAEMPNVKIGGEWTIAVDLRGDRSIEPGNRFKLDKLKELAEKTKDSDVAVVAQIAVSAKPLSHADFSAGKKAEPNKLERYLIKDGKVTEIFEGDSKGAAADDRDLLAYADKAAPSKKLGLIVAMHGGAEDGVGGIGGKASLDDIGNAIDDGLKDSGRKKLDMLDFDCCIMGNTKVVEKFKDRTDNLVASTETESDDIWNKTFMSQNLTKNIGDLIDKPSMSGKEFARDFIETAKQGFNDGSKDMQNEASGTATLSQYDTTKLPAFESKLNALGKNLAHLAEDPQLKQQIKDAVANTPTGIDKGPRRDIKLFTDELLKSIDAGKIPDIDGWLKTSINNLLKAKADLVVDYRGEAEGGYDKWGGLSVYLPNDSEPLEKSYDAQLTKSQTDLPSAPDWSNFVTTIK